MTSNISKFIDSHCHLNFRCFDPIRAALLKDSTDKNILNFILPSIDQDGWAKIIDLAKSYPPLYYALGLHPNFLSSYKDCHLEELEKILISKESKCVAIGEIGLDITSNTDLALQEKVFMEQLILAQKYKLPVILHIRGKVSRVLEILKLNKFNCGGVFHAFSGSLEIAKEFIKLGFYIGIGGVITYPNSTKTRKTVSKLPIESLLLETDSPDMPVYQQETLLNIPINILKVFDALCELKSESREVLANQILKNTKELFLID